jgi:oxygen-independent coproporphyrinogen-3 oxidase
LPIPLNLQPHLRDLCTAAQAEPLGLYLHFPFCKDRCTYCSFVTTRNTEFQPAVGARLLTDLRTWGEALEQPSLDTLYFGGGTPSLLGMNQLTTLTRTLRGAFRTEGLEEATLEANPGTVDLDWLQAARGLGWDRLSLGVQTFDDALLSRLGRIHNGATALAAFALAQRAGFRRLSGDLMVGIPGQRLAGVLEDAERLAAAGATHLSIYLLDLDKACPLSAEIAAGRLALPSEDAVADVFEALQERLPDLGLQPYEISNYAVPGEESRHNNRYWQRRPYLGLGPSAASQLGAFRWTEASGIPAWAEGRGLAEVQELNPEEELAEIPLLGLRLHRGVDWAGLRQRAQARNLVPLVDAWAAKLRTFAQQGLATWEGEQVQLTPRGMLLSNGILEMFV